MPDTNHPTAEPSNTTETRARTTKNALSAPAAIQSDAPASKRRAHFVLQGKGGVGKTYIASLIAQYLTDRGQLDKCFDTDPVNGSLQTIPALSAEPVELLIKNAINIKGVDRLIDGILSAKSDIMIDNGAASFLTLSRYLVENDIASVLREHGVSMVVHTVVTGGANGMDTLKGLETLLLAFTPSAKVVVWVNEFFGPARYRDRVEQSGVYLDNHTQLKGVIRLHQLDTKMFAPNLAEMLNRKLTFSEAAQSGDFMLMEKSRLHRIKMPIWQQLGTCSNHGPRQTAGTHKKETGVKIDLEDPMLAVAVLHEDARLAWSEWRQ